MALINPNKRLNPTADTIRKLLLRSGNECAFPNCNEVLFTNDDKLIAECCHIEAALPGGERYNINQTDEERRNYANLLFLCHRHHVETNDVSKYEVSILKKMKLDHESRFSEKSFSVKSDYVQQVLAWLNEITTKLDRTLELLRELTKNKM